MQARFGADFDEVRVHSDSNASAVAEGMQAEALTLGENVVFNEGRFEPGRQNSQRLLAHELAHVLQQRRRGPSAPGGRAMEQSAAEAADLVDQRNNPVDIAGASAPGVALQPKEVKVEDGPKIDFERSGDINIVKVANVPLLASHIGPNSKIAVAVNWSPQAPGVLQLAILRRREDPVILNPQAFGLLAALGYKLVINERLLPSELPLGERPITLGGELPPLRPPRPKTSKKSAPPHKKPEQKPPAALPPLPAPKVELPPPPAPDITTDVAPPPPTPIRDEQPLTPAQAAKTEEAPQQPAPPREPDLPVRTPDELIDDHTSWWGNLHEEELGSDLLQRALHGDPDYVQRVLDTLGSTDRDDVSVAFAEDATDDQLRQLASTPQGRRLLDRLFDELTAGEVGSDEQKQADRILAIKTQAVIPEQEFAKGAEYARTHIVLPYKKTGLTVLTPSPIYARRLPDGKIAIHLRGDIYGTDYYRDPDIRLPDRIWDEVVLNETDVVGVKFYDEGGVISYFPATYLLQLENESTRIAYEKAAEAFGIGLTLGFGGAGAAGGEAVAGTTEATLAVRVGSAVRTGVVWADRIAFGLDLANSVIQEHRGWIIETFPNYGRPFVTGLDQITAYVRIYGLVRGGVGLARLGNSLRKSYNNWRAAVQVAKLTEDELKNVEQISQRTEELLNSIDEAAKAQPPAATPPPAALAPDAVPPQEPVRAGGEAPIRDVFEGGGKTTTRKTGHLRVAASEGVVLEPPEVADPQEVLDEFEQDVKAVSGSKERFAEPKAVRRIVQPKQKPAAAGETVVETPEPPAPQKSDKGGGGRGGGGGRRTGAQVEKQEIKKYVLEVKKEELQGIKRDPTEFLAVHEKVTIRKQQVGGNSDFTSIAKELDNASNLRVQASKAPLPLNPKKIDALLKEGEINFIKRHPDLDQIYTQLDDLTKGKTVPEFENLQLTQKRIEEIREELEALQLRKVGSLRTDITEVWFDQQRVEIADISLRENDPLHEFKTLLYKRVMEEMLPGYGVRAQDIKPTQGNYWKYLFKLVGE